MSSAVVKMGGGSVAPFSCGRLGPRFRGPGSGLQAPGSGLRAPALDFFPLSFPCGLGLCPFSEKYKHFSIKKRCSLGFYLFLLKSVFFRYRNCFFFVWKKTCVFGKKTMVFGKNTCVEKKHVFLGKNYGFR